MSVPTQLRISNHPVAGIGCELRKFYPSPKMCQTPLMAGLGETVRSGRVGEVSSRLLYCVPWRLLIPLTRPIVPMSMIFSMYRKYGKTPVGMRSHFPAFLNSTINRVKFNVFCKIYYMHFRELLYTPKIAVETYFMKLKKCGPAAVVPKNNTIPNKLSNVLLNTIPNKSSNVLLTYTECFEN